ncbi:protein inturned isoform X1 [Procambarus clarkii]|uniref:protein inturned isoform X1 n=2 Tax=Procambarus clarkii TaxID=6728 RepID=UPI001E671838|nr:protein inturned-like isoform X1 [Procambarus clarkii]
MEPANDFDSNSESYSASSRQSEESSYEYEDAEWLKHVQNDGSLLYVESYVSSTVREKQVQALKASGGIEKKPAFSSPSKEIKKKNKLLRLLKRRPSVRVKGTHRVGGGGEGGTKGGSDLTSPPKVTFRDNPSGEVRKVNLQVYEGGNNLGRRASLCETVLGVVPGRFSETPDSRVMVAGLVPGSQALRNGVIKIGDWLKEVDETDVTWDNLDDILAELQIPSTITLSVQKCASETLPDELENDRKRVTQTQLVKVVTGVEVNSPDPSYLQELPHTLLYLSLVGVTEDSPDGADIRYQFPNWSNKLVKVRGMFITTAHTVQEVVGAPALCSTVCLDGEYYHVAYVRENNDVFLLALPHSYVSSHDIVALMEQIASLIRFEFDTLSKGVGNAKNKAYLDHLMSHILGTVLGQGPREQKDPGRLESELTGKQLAAKLNPYLPLIPITPQSFIFAYPSWLILQDGGETKLQIDNCLSELESGDFGDDDSDYEESLSLYNILGSCVFYKGHLVASHLSSEDLRNVWLFTCHHGLLSLTTHESVSQLVAWRSVYPSGDCSNATRDDRVKHYLLVVAMNHCILGLLLEAGGVTEFVDEGAGPDPFLVDQAEASLYQLHALHVNSVCEESLVSGGIETISADDKFGKVTPSKKGKERNDIVEAGGLRLPDVPSILKQKSSPLPESRLHIHDHTGCECEGSLGETSEDSFTHSSHDSSLALEEDEEGDDESESDWRIYKPTENRGLHQYDLDIKSPHQRQPISPIRVTCGKDGVLFHLVQLEVGEGVIIQSEPSAVSSSPAASPISATPMQPPPPFHAQVLQSFRSTCAHIHHVLHAAIRGKEPNGNYSVSTALNGIKEHGVLFTYTPPNTDGGTTGKRRTQTFSYWVVGRLLVAPYQREVYVCFHESVPQNVLELAFKVSLGCVI